MPWIHVEDLARQFAYLAQHPEEGVWNGVGPYSVTNAEFSKTLAHILNRPYFFPPYRPGPCVLRSEKWPKSA